MITRIPTLTYVNKDITTVDRGIIAHGVNTQAVMGSGVALFLKQKYPQIFSEYHRICWEACTANKEDELLGLVDFVEINTDLFVANCFTQHLYGSAGKFARPEAIRKSLETVFYIAGRKNLSVYLPKIGAGRGGLDWETEVEPILTKLVNNNPNVDTYVCIWAE